MLSEAWRFQLNFPGAQPAAA